MTIIVLMVDKAPNCSACVHVILKTLHFGRCKILKYINAIVFYDELHIHSSIVKGLH